MATRYAFFIHLRALPEWLRLPREQRRELGEAHLHALLPRYQGALRLRHFDAEAFAAPCSDLMLVETDDPLKHYDFMERLRDSPCSPCRISRCCRSCLPSKTAMWRSSAPKRLRLPCSRPAPEPCAWAAGPARQCRP